MRINMTVVAALLALPCFGAAPAVSAVVNGSSTIPAGFPNSGVAPSSLFQIQGSGMATPGTVPVLQDSTQGLPLTLNGTTVSVTVGGVTVSPALYYSSPTLVAGVMPAATPVGTGTITVSYNGTPSAAAPIQIVSSAYGFTTYLGLGVATDAVSGALITYTNSAKPGQILVFWGTGLGSDQADSDTTYSNSPHAINTPVQMYIGGVPVPAASIAYSGASVYPGVDVIGVTVPAGVINGCESPVAIVTGSGANAVVSNVVALPIMDNGGVCSGSGLDASLDGNTITAYKSQDTVTSGAVEIGVSTDNGVSGGIALVSFVSIAGPEFIYPSATGGVSLGGCTTLQILQTSTNIVAANETGLNGGTVSFQGPSGTMVLPDFGEFYEADLSGSAIPGVGSTVFFTGTGSTSVGGSVGPLNASLTVPSPAMNWTNQSAVATVNRSQGVTVTWTGGAPGSFLFISGITSVGGSNGSFHCYAPQSAGQFTVPGYILMALPAGSGSITLEDLLETPLSVAGIQYIYGLAYTGITASSKFQ